jgi:hypothetical protein
LNNFEKPLIYLIFRVAEKTILRRAKIPVIVPKVKPYISPGSQVLDIDPLIGSHKIGHEFKPPWGRLSYVLKKA